MDLDLILDINTIKVGLDGHSKEEVISELTELLFNNGYVNDIKQFEVDIYNRESQGQTGIGNYIAIPHGMSSAVDKIGVAIGVSEQEIPWETLDGKGVKIIILFSVSNAEDNGNDHLKLLASFARKLGNDQIIDELLNAKTSKEIIETFTKG